MGYIKPVSNNTSDLHSYMVRAILTLPAERYKSASKNVQIGVVFGQIHGFTNLHIFTISAWNPSKSCYTGKIAEGVNFRKFVNPIEQMFD